MSGIYQFSMLSLMFVLVYWRVFVELTTLIGQSTTKLPHDSAAAQFYETDIELLDGKVMTGQFMPSVALVGPGS